MTPLRTFSTKTEAPKASPLSRLFCSHSSSFSPPPRLSGPLMYVSEPRVNSAVATNNNSGQNGRHFGSVAGPQGGEIWPQCLPASPDGRMDGRMEENIDRLGQQTIRLDGQKADLSGCQLYNYSPLRSVLPSFLPVNLMKMEWPKKSLPFFFSLVSRQRAAKQEGGKIMTLIISSRTFFHLKASSFSF